MQIKDLTIEEFRQLIKTCIRETVEDIIVEGLRTIREAFESVAGKMNF